MIPFAGKAILLDIEGTTSSISFVYDVMFPFARRELRSYLDANWNSEKLKSACDQLAADAGHASLSAWTNAARDEDSNHRSTGETEFQKQLVVDEVTRLMDNDVKSTGLKAIQGLVWKSGFESGEMKAHLYADVRPAIQRWCETGIDVRIYSSGSIAAQKLFFGHTVEGNLLGCFRGHYDTTTGPKRELESYQTIASHMEIDPSKILFLSDVDAELDAASNAGMQTGLCIRPGNAEVVDSRHPSIDSFEQVSLEG